MTQNILFIMCDQLRWDYLSCAGHPHLETPNIDRLAQKGVRFEHAYCQSPLCGPSRACFYTGRYMSSHGATVNENPLRVDELRLGDHLRNAGMRTVLVGKSGASANPAGLERLQIDPTSEVGRTRAQDGFEPFERFAGMHPDPIVQADLGYNAYLRAHGYAGDNPWELYANSAYDHAGQRVSGWQLRHADKPALVAEEHSETAFTTNRAIEFLEQAGDDQPWCLHVSYIKPHWPLLAPAPYHNLYGPEQLLRVRQSAIERENPHPVYAAFMQQEYSQNYARAQVRRRVIPTYMGLVKQIDDHLGRLFAYLEEKGQMEKTLIVFTSDHGDYLGDHWLGEKDLFHEPSVRIPLIVYDPSREADATRGTVDERFVEAIDLVPTFVEFAGGEVEENRLEGRSLLPLLRAESATGDRPVWRDYTISEIDYSDRGPRTLLDLHPYDCRAYMLRTMRWKYILHERFRPQLFDLANDPDEFVDLGADPGYEATRRELHDQLFTWLRRRRIRTEMPTASLFDMGPERDEQMGIVIGRW